MTRYLTVIAALVCSATVYALEVDRNLVKKSFEQDFAATVILTNSDVVTFGIVDFNPNELLRTDNEELGSEQALESRKNIGVTTLPYTFSLDPDDEVQNHFLTLKLAALRIEQDVDLRGFEGSDIHVEIIVDGYVRYQYKKYLNDSWDITYGLGSHLMYYHSDYRYQSSPLGNFKQFLDGDVVNTSAWSNIIEPEAVISYTKPTDWGSWTFKSGYHYMYGVSWGEANKGDLGNPEGWYVTNGIEGFYDVVHWGRSVQTLFGRVNRVDIGGDVSEPFGTNHYYEGTIGWLMTPPFNSDWIDNFGIGININYGSALKGGSIILLFNQD
ncbi:Solitary outer membrane autotransporter beta-barrel domain [Vibrio maerlii]|uniref:Solitary outer membrane autotransporter beta-barrel domain n=1 Tax=Vibrio maerlii TaxID=2231648 RepID=UPI000E3BDD98|nr:Solitary outer membrane autotransporter beta-barrel domain [Vibrio maerlii]